MDRFLGSILSRFRLLSGSSVPLQSVSLGHVTTSVDLGTNMNLLITNNYPTVIFPEQVECVYIRDGTQQNQPQYAVHWRMHA